MGAGSSFSADVIESKADAWDEGYRAGMDLGLSIGERVIGIRSDWPAVTRNPYRQEGSKAYNGSSPLNTKGSR